MNAHAALTQQAAIRPRAAGGDYSPATATPGLTEYGRETIHEGTVNPVRGGSLLIYLPNQTTRRLYSHERRDRPITGTGAW